MPTLAPFGKACSEAEGVGRETAQLQPKLFSSPTPEESLPSFTAAFPTAPSVQSRQLLHCQQDKEGSRFPEHVESWDLLRATGPAPPLPQSQSPTETQEFSAPPPGGCPIQAVWLDWVA